MRWTSQCDWSAGDLPEASWPPTRWPEWVPGLSVDRWEGDEHGGRAWIRLAGPRPFEVEVSIDRKPERLEVAQAAGFPRDLSAVLQLGDSGLLLEIEVDFEIGLPNALRLELQERWAPGMLEALIGAPRSGS